MSKKKMRKPELDTSVIDSYLEQLPGQALDWDHIRSASELQEMTVKVIATGDNLAAFAQLCGVIMGLAATDITRTVAVPVHGENGIQLSFDFGATDVSEVVIPPLLSEPVFVKAIR